jgi:hypothetical protein
MIGTPSVRASASTIPNDSMLDAESKRSLSAIVSFTASGKSSPTSVTRWRKVGAVAKTRQAAACAESCVRLPTIVIVTSSCGSRLVASALNRRSTPLPGTRCATTATRSVLDGGGSGASPVARRPGSLLTTGGEPLHSRSIVRRMNRLGATQPARCVKASVSSAESSPGCTSEP